MSIRTTLLICLLVVLVGAGATALIFRTEPAAERSGAVRENAMLVDVLGVKRDTYSPSILAMGTVEPEQDVMLSPRINGQVLRIANTFVPGGVVRKGDVLLQIDPADYQNVLAQRQSTLNQAIAELNIEEGRQQVARQDFALLGDSITLENRSLVLREPQLESARAIVESARAAVEQAQLELDRTTIRAPFDAHILSRNVNVGSQVALGENLGRLVGIDTYWVVATVPQSELRWLMFPERGATPSSVKIRNRTAWNADEYRTGTLHQLVGALENQTRLARVIIDVADPLGYEAEDKDLPPLMIGAFVETAIDARPMTDVFRLNRDYLRKDNTVWVMEDEVLRIKDVTVLFQDAEYAYISAGLEDGNQVVITNLSTVVEGAPLRLEGDTMPRDTGPLPETDTPGN
ncbi:MAG: efflux RND transporter periplasmic adaptor subunit [Rhodothermaceae bacterium]|nr:efflux RND transporter periplasmic adaptor subunit [Rhodothermaceae bacterium]